MLVTATALAVDIGREAAENRRLQATADAAALDGARELTGGPYSAVYTNVYNAVMANAGRNKINNPENVLSVEVGTWTPLTQVFTPVTSDTPWPNAVRVTMHDTFNNLFALGTNSLTRAAVADGDGLVCTGPCTTSTSTTTTSTTRHDDDSTTTTTTTTPSTTTTTVCTTGDCPQPKVAGFWLGSYAVAIESNCGSGSAAATCEEATELNGLLNYNLGITGIGYQGLAASNITLAGLLAANSTIGSLNSLLNSSFTGAQFGTIVANAIQYCENPNPNCNASNNLAQINAYTAAIQTAFSAGGGGTIQIGKFVNAAIGQSGAASAASISLGSLLFGGAILFNGGHAVSIPNLGVSVPNLTSASASVYLISPQSQYRGPVTPTYLAAPAQNTQGNGTLTLNLTSTNAANVVATMPYTLAQADGWLTAIGCDGGSNSPPTYFQVYVTTSGASVGNPGGGQVTMTVLGTPVTGTITGAVGGSTGQTLTFNAPYPAATQSVLGNVTVPSLSVTLNLTASPAVNLLLPAIQASLNTSINASVNPSLTALSQLVGIGVGNADVDPENVQCQGPLLGNHG